MNMRKLRAAIAVTAAAVLGLSGCAANGAGKADRPIKIAVFSGWDESVATSHLWKAILESKGYRVDLEEAEVAAAFSGLSTADYDLALDAWLPITHQEYVQDFSEDIVDMGAWNEEAKLTIAVNADAPINSLEELAANADQFGNRLVGIEAGSGLVSVTEQDVIPGYGLGGMEFLTSSTPAMLSELDTAMNSGENIAVTLWRPHWAYNAYELKDLEDPKGLLGETEHLHSYASASFEGDFPQVAQWIRGFKMSSELLYSLEAAMFQGGQSSDEEYEAAVANWITENQAYVDSLTSDSGPAGTAPAEGTAPPSGNPGDEPAGSATPTP